MHPDPLVLFLVLLDHLTDSPAAGPAVRPRPAPQPHLVHRPGPFPEARLHRSLGNPFAKAYVHGDWLLIIVFSSLPQRVIFYPT
jgi:hypothetical protein